MSTVKSYFHIFFAGIARIGLRNHDQPWNYGHRLSYFTARFGRIYGYFLTLIRVDQEIMRDNDYDCDYDIITWQS